MYWSYICVILFSFWSVISWNFSKKLSSKYNVWWYNESYWILHDTGLSGVSVWLYFIKLTNTAIHSKPITSWGTLVAVLTNYIGFAVALASHFIALTTEGALRITMAGWKQSGDNTISLYKTLYAFRITVHLHRAPSWMMEEILQMSLEHISASAGIGVIRKESIHM